MSGMWDDILDVVQGVFGKTTPNGSAVITTVVSQKVTVAEAVDAIKALEGVPWSALASGLEKAVQNPQTDLATLQAIVTALTPLDPPLGAEATLALKVASIIFTMVKSSGLKIEGGTPEWNGAHRGSNPNG